VIYTDHSPTVLGLHDFQNALTAIRPSSDIDVIMTTYALRQKYESLVHPMFRWQGLMFAGIPVVASSTVPAGEVWFLHGTEIVGKLSNRTAA
jgi:hypothetical protein